MLSLCRIMARAAKPMARSRERRSALRSTPPRRLRPASSPCWQFPVSAPSSAPDGSRLCWAAWRSARRRRPARGADKCRHQRRRHADLCRGRAPRRNRGRRTGAAERIAADRADHEPVGGESAGTQRTLQESGLAIIRSERRALYRRPGSQRTRAACALADRSEFDVRQGSDQPVASFSVDGRDPEAAVILEQLLLGIMVVAVTLLLLPFLLVMAGVGAAMLLWFVISAAVLGTLVFWLVFPGTYGLAVLLLALVIGLLLVDRRTRHGAS